MSQLQGEKKKETQEKYRLIYAARMAGFSHAALREKFNCSEATIERALKWGKNSGLNKIPEDDEFKKNTFITSLTRRAKLSQLFDDLIDNIEGRKKNDKKDKALIVNEDNLLKISKEIRELDIFCLAMKEIVIDKRKIEVTLEVKRPLADIYKDLRSHKTEDIEKFVKEDS